jgi:hypothetical protein
VVFDVATGDAIYRSIHYTSKQVKCATEQQLARQQQLETHSSEFPAFQNTEADPGSSNNYSYQP